MHAEHVELAKMQGEIRISQGRQLDPLQLILDVQHFKKELQGLKQATHETGRTHDDTRQPQGLSETREQSCSGVPHISSSRKRGPTIRSTRRHALF